MTKIRNSKFDAILILSKIATKTMKMNLYLNKFFLCFLHASNPGPIGNTFVYLNNVTAF